MRFTIFQFDVKVLTMDVMAELKEVGSLFTAGNLVGGLENLRGLWSRIPDPKTDTANAYLVIEYGVALSLKSGDLDEAQRWAQFAPDFSEVRHDMGEVEFLIGKVAFARGELEAAKKEFEIAYTKSEGRAFEGKGNEYLKLIRLTH